MPRHAPGGGVTETRRWDGGFSFRLSGGYDAASEGILTRQENLAGRSVVWNTERPSGGEGEGDGRGRFASDVSFLRRADGVPCGAERNSPDPLRSPLPRNGSVFHDGG